MPRPDIPITRGQLRSAAGAGSWERGVRYFENGNVKEATADRDRIVGVVTGQRPYRVSLRVRGGRVTGQCSCPMGDERVFCKHCVALGLEWIATSGKASPADADTPSCARPATWDDVRSHLASRPVSELVETIVDQAMGDTALRQKLFIRAALHKAGGPTPEAIRAMIDEAARACARDLTSWRQTARFAAGFDDVLDAIERLPQDQASPIVDIIRYAMSKIEETLAGADDSNGDLGFLIRRANEIHHKACQAARPDPQALARWLFHWLVAQESFSF
ncbi:MAG TPA: SWIM zinc finger family protein, partial [Candidatus Brocadiia bacterium]|nr:SWIM zinc finger family protein [Candidatus Brocadiia bacterium]